MQQKLWMNIIQGTLTKMNASVLFDYPLNMTAHQSCMIGKKTIKADAGQMKNTLFAGDGNSVKTILF